MKSYKREKKETELVRGRRFLSQPSGKLSSWDSLSELYQIVQNYKLGSV